MVEVIGINHVLELSKQLNCEKQMILGYRDSLFLIEDFKQYGEVFIATEDGSSGKQREMFWMRFGK